MLVEEKNLLEFKIKGERHTLPNLLKSRLLLDKSVSFAAYKLRHPSDPDALFVVRTTGTKTPQKALQDAIASIESDLTELEKAVKQAFK